MRRSEADGRRAWRLAQKVQTGLIRRACNPSMKMTGGQAHRGKELRQAERPTKTLPAGLKEAQREKKAVLPHQKLTGIPSAKLSISVVPSLSYW